MSNEVGRMQHQVDAWNAKLTTLRSTCSKDGEP